MSKNIRKEVLKCIRRYDLKAHEDCINTMIGIVRLGGDIHSLLSNPTFEYNDIYKEYRELRKSKVAPVTEYSIR